MVSSRLHGNKLRSSGQLTWEGRYRWINAALEKSGQPAGSGCAPTVVLSRLGSSWGRFVNCFWGLRPRLLSCAQKSSAYRRRSWKPRVSAFLDVDLMYFSQLEPKVFKRHLSFFRLRNFLEKQKMFMIFNSFVFRSHERITGPDFEKKVGVQVIILLLTVWGVHVLIQTFKLREQKAKCTHTTGRGWQ